MSLPRKSIEELADGASGESNVQKQSASTREANAGRALVQPRKDRLRHTPEPVEFLELPDDVHLEGVESVSTSTSESTSSARRPRAGLVVACVALCVTGVLCIVGLGAYVDFVALYRTDTLAAVFLALAWACVVFPVMLWLGMRVLRYRKRRRNNRIRLLVLSVDEESATRELRRELAEYFEERRLSGKLSGKETRNAIEWLNQDRFWADGDGIKQAFAPLDETAHETISKVALATAISTAISQRGWMDVMLVVSKGVYLVTQISEIYGLRAGKVGSVRLFYRSFRNGVLAGTFQAAGDASGTAVAQFLGGLPWLGKGFSMAAQGILNGSIMLRLGCACVEECRPIPTSESETRRVLHFLMRSVKSTVLRIVRRARPKSTTEQADDEQAEARSNA